MLSNSNKGEPVWSIKDASLALVVLSSNFSLICDCTCVEWYFMKFFQACKLPIITIYPLPVKGFKHVTFHLNCYLQLI